MQLQGKSDETEAAQRELAQVKFNLEKARGELERAKQDGMTKDYSLRGYTELAELNKDLNARNLEMVTKLNNLQCKLDQVDQQEKEIVAVKE